MTHILINIPRLKDRTEADMETFLSDLHRQLLGLTTQNQLVSLEVLLKNKFLHFYLSLPQSTSDIVSGQVYTHFPGIELIETDDYLTSLPRQSLFGCTLRPERSDMYPIKTYSSFSADSLITLAGVCSKMTDEESAFIHVILKPIRDTWEEQGKRYMKRFVHIRYESKEAYEGLLSKFEKLYYSTTIRIGVCAPKEQVCQQRLGSLVNSFSQFENKTINTLIIRTKYSGEKAREMCANRFHDHPFLLNVEELASMYHFPSPVAIPNIIHVLSRKASPPPNLPQAEFLKKEDISTFAITNFRNEYTPFGIKRLDRRRHLYVVGKTGMGKSKLLEILMLTDVYQGLGFAVLDPHGDLAEQMLTYIPQKRMKDVIYFNPADEKCPIGFNPLEVTDRLYYQNVVTGFLAIFKKLFIFGWTPRLEHMLRFITLALLETKDATVVDIPRLLTNKSYRQGVIAQIQDPVVKDFWTHEFASWNEKYDNEAIVPILNKVSEFTSSPLIRNTLGQKKSSFQISDVMDQNKIFIANLSSGKLGEENSALLGSMIVTQIQQAAMERAHLPEEERKDFLLYVDEFQNFATSAFATILSEARKYRLSLTIAHQYVNQLDSHIQKTVFGNIGSMIIFRVGAQDAKFFATELSPVFTDEDLMNLDARHMAVKLSIDGATAPPFSAQTITLPKISRSYAGEIIRMSQTTYGQTPREKNDQEDQNEENDQSAEFLFDEKKSVPTFEEPII